MVKKTLLRRIRACAAVILALIGAAVLGLSGHPAEDAIATLDHAPPGAPACGVLSVPSLGVKATLSLLRDGCDCACGFGLYNGGIILCGDAAEWAGLELYATARIRAEGASMALELVEIINCIRLGDYLIGTHGVVRPHGDVLLCVQRPPPWGFRVYRWTML